MITSSLKNHLVEAGMARRRHFHDVAAIFLHSIFILAERRWTLA